MDIWRCRGGRRLEGSCTVQGSKNASLPILAACIALPVCAELSNVPEISDVDSALEIIRLLGCRAQRKDNNIYIDSCTASAYEVPSAQMMKMRSSVFFMGALLARFGRAKLSFPGGCLLGKRPIDIHIDALRKMGARIDENGGELDCRADSLVGTELFLPYPSVGATENIMLAALKAEGETIIHGAAKEPEIVCLQNFMRNIGCEIIGAGTDTIKIGRTESRGAVQFDIIPDRIAASTLACAVALCGGDVQLNNSEYTHFSSVLHFLKCAGCDIIKSKKSVRVVSDGKANAVREIITGPYPAFPTDAQPLLMAALLKADGESRFKENVFESRFRHVGELIKLGADIRIEEDTALVRGVERLHGANMEATDLRGGAAMLIAALAADGESVIYDTGHIRRGYESLDRTLSQLGADIEYTVQ